MVDSPPHPATMQSNPAIRDDAIDKANIAVVRAKSGRPTQGVLLVGRNRTARTAHIDRICEVLSTTGAHIVRVRMSKGRSLPALLSNQLQDALQRMPGIRQRQGPVHEALRVLAACIGSLRPRYPDINIIMDLKPEAKIADSGTLEVDLTSLFEAIGAEAAQAGAAYAILIDDMHSVEARQLSALIGALHRIAQRGLPVVMIGAGSQILRRRIGNAKPYAERMFVFVDLGG